MDKFLSWFIVKHKKEDGTKEQKVDADIAVYDPKVDEFFKDFPSPYREKVVQHYSKREGLSKLDFFRAILMKHELDCAERGIFLQDERDLNEQDEQRKQELKLIEKDKIISAREPLEWEKKLMSYIPLQPGDTVSFKIFQTANLSLIGLSLLWIAFHDRKKFTRPVFFTRVFLGTSGCLTAQAMAAHRFLDLGLFDKSSDRRNVFDKSLEEATETSKIIFNHLLDILAKAEASSKKD
ncbi:hypothetical protein Btru_003005 [Bulinus truncatus]|nr:hypothetical protein Btru_003005 [Bulinus truncatus]